jgi:hypothetical protein
VKAADKPQQRLQPEVKKMDTLLHRFVLSANVLSSIVTASKKWLPAHCSRGDVLRQFPALGINKHESVQSRQRISRSEQKLTTAVSDSLNFGSGPVKSPGDKTPCLVFI